MSKAKIDSIEYDEMRNQVQYAADCLAECDQLWGDRFEDLYYAFITSGYLNDLYEDAKSNYYTLKKSVSALSNVATGASLGCVIGSVIPGVGNIAGAIIGAVIGLVFGIYNFCTTDPTWITTSKEVFEQLLTDCVNGNNDCYIGITNIGTKLLNVQISLEEIRTLVNEFNYAYASLEDSMNAFGLKGTMTDDGVLLSVDTEIVVDGQTITTSVSEALNAFYTYQNTVMASRIEADVLASQGYEIDYDALVKNANGFIVNTLNSGLYSKEFIDALLPNYTPDVAGATDAAAAGLGLTTSDFQSALAKASSIVGVGAGLIGAGFIGQIADPNGGGGTGTCPKCGLPTAQCTCGGGTGGTCPTCGKPTAQCTCSANKCPNCGGDPTKCGCNGNTTSKCPNCGGDPNKCGCGSKNNGGCNCDHTGGTTSGGGGGGTVINNYYYGDQGSTGGTPDTSKPDTETETEGNDVEIETISKTEIPETVESGITKDYDDLARREYEALGEEEIAERRAEIMEDVDDAFASGNFNSIKSKLKEYGYSEPEINALINDRDKLATALISGDQREFMAEKAMELAKADGVKDFESSYSEPAEYSDLTDGTANTLIANMSSDKEVSKAWEGLTSATTAYEEKVEEAVVAVEAVAVAKTAMTALEDKFTKEFGSSDPSKWSKEAAEEYNESVKEYNEKVKDAEGKLKAKDEAKEEYDEALEEYEEAKEDFEKRIKDNFVNDDSTPSDTTSSNNGNTGGIAGNQGNNNGNQGNNNQGNTGNNGNTGNTTGKPNYIPVDQDFPGIALGTPSDNSLYAGENLGSNGVYTETVAVTSADGTTQEFVRTSEGADFMNDAPSVSTGVDSTTSSVVSGGTDANGNAQNIVSLSNDDIMAALLLQEEEAKMK